MGRKTLITILALVVIGLFFTQLLVVVDDILRLSNTKKSGRLKGEVTRCRNLKDVGSQRVKGDGQGVEYVFASFSFTLDVGLTSEWRIVRMRSGVEVKHTLSPQEIEEVPTRVSCSSFENSRLWQQLQRSSGNQVGVERRHSSQVASRGQYSLGTVQGLVQEARALGNGSSQLALGEQVLSRRESESRLTQDEREAYWLSNRQEKMHRSLDKWHLLPCCSCIFPQDLRASLCPLTSDEVWEHWGEGVETHPLTTTPSGSSVGSRARAPPSA